MAQLYAMAERLGFAVEVTWGAELHLVDALFAADVDGGEMIPHVPAFHGLHRHGSGPSTGLASAPLMADTARSIVPSLRASSKERLNSHMRPSSYIVTRQIPLTSNGKLDRDALAERARDVVAAAALSRRRARFRRVGVEEFDAAPDDDGGSLLRDLVPVREVRVVVVLTVERGDELYVAAERDAEPRG